MARKGKNKAKSENKPTSIPTLQTHPPKLNGATSQPPTQVTPLNPNALSADAGNYKNTLLAYYKYMHQLPPQREWMKFKFGLKMRDLFDAKKNINILAVGAGAGDVDIDFLNEIVHCGAQRCGVNGYSVNYQIIEPNPENVQAFRNRVAHKADYQRIKFQWFTVSFEKFVADFRLQAASEENKFDFVHFVRCFYHIDSRYAFDTTYNTLLAKHGIMCAIGENEDAFWPRMMHFLAEHNMSHECFMVSGQKSQKYFLPGWLEQCRQRDWRYESYAQGYKFDVTPMYEVNNGDGNLLLDFVMHVKNSRQNVPTKILEDFFQFLSNGVKERLVVKNGIQVVQKVYPCEMGAIMITKE